MNFVPVDFSDFQISAIDIWRKRWFVLACGDFQSGHFNAMTVSWGSIGVMWDKPFVQVVVRPTRYTFEFMGKYDSFSLCSFPEKYRQALKIMGSTSGRKIDKIARAKLTPIACGKIVSPAFAEAELVIECRKIYWDDFCPKNFDPPIEKNYPRKDYHRIYFGEILSLLKAQVYEAL